MQFVSLDDIQLSEASGFKMKQGELYRVSFGFFPGTVEGSPDFDKAPLFAQAKSMYIPGIGKLIDEGPQSELSGQPSKLYYATAIVAWPTKKSGQVSKERLEDREIDVTVLRVTKNRLRDIRRAFEVKGVPFGSADVLMDCTDEKFQTATYTILDESLLSKLSTGSDESKEIYREVLEKVQGQVQNIETIFGRKISVDDLRVKLAEGNAKDANTSGSDITGAVPPAASAPPSVSTADVDDLLAGL